MLELALIAVLLAQTSPAASPSETWETLEADYQAAFERWIDERREALAQGTAEPMPVAQFRARFTALAENGEGRAVLWLIENPAEGESARLLELVEAGGEEEWVGSALQRLAFARASFDRARLDALFEKHMTGASSNDLRAYAALARASLVAEEDPALAGNLAVWAAMLRHKGLEIELGEVLAPEALADLAQETVRQVQRDSGRHFTSAYTRASGGSYLPRPGAPLDPEVRWRPALEELASRGARPAQLWALSKASWQPDAAEVERLQGYLEALTATPLSTDELGDFSNYEIQALAKKLGSEVVEACVRGLIEQSPDADRAELTFGLGDALCAEAGADAAQLERGLALLREVQERWPASEQAQAAAGRVFRFTKLQIGMPCPDFESVDADGKAFKVSDYKGKVTVVDFWGFW